MSDVFQTVSADNVDVYKLDELAKQFNLANELLS